MCVGLDEVDRIMCEMANYFSLPKAWHLGSSYIGSSLSFNTKTCKKNGHKERNVHPKEVQGLSLLIFCRRHGLGVAVFILL